MRIDGYRRLSEYSVIIIVILLIVIIIVVMVILLIIIVKMEILKVRNGTKFPEDLKVKIGLHQGSVLSKCCSPLCLMLLQVKQERAC